MTSTNFSSSGSPPIRLSSSADWPLWDRAFRARVHRANLQGYILGNQALPDFVEPPMPPHPTEMDGDSTFHISYMLYYNAQVDRGRNFWSRYNQLTAWVEDTVDARWHCECLQPDRTLRD